MSRKLLDWALIGVFVVIRSNTVRVTLQTLNISSLDSHWTFVVVVVVVVVVVIDVVVVVVCRNLSHNRRHYFKRTLGLITLMQFTRDFLWGSNVIERAGTRQKLPIFFHQNFASDTPNNIHLPMFFNKLPGMGNFICILRKHWPELKRVFILTCCL